MPKPNLDNAYALNSDADTKKMYADWAETYDQTFVTDMDFVGHLRVAEAFVGAGGAGPVLDFGSGTGTLGEELQRLGVEPLDAIDLSPEMLSVAQRKGVYRQLFEGNLLDGFTVDDRYDGIVSSGTFTHGHVGPNAIDALLSLAIPGALFVLAINSKHFEKLGFAAKFEELAGQISGLRLPVVRYYGDAATGDHMDDTGKLATFRKA